MFRFYTPILLLQGFCMYHAYSSNSDRKWFWVIMFFPLFGCLIYIYHHFYSRQNIDIVADGIMEVMNKDYKVEQLKKEMKFADTISNKMQLANKYTELGHYQEAVELYESCLKGFNKNDPDIFRKLVKVNYLNKNYKSAISYGSQLDDYNLFQNSEERIAYVWSLYYENKLELAESNFQDMDRRFLNYMHRMEYAKFLHQTGRLGEAKAKLEELLEEIDHMSRQEKRMKKEVYRAIRNLYGSW